jgi:ferredoxin/flavodoxin---NADP+ reductase
METPVLDPIRRPIGPRPATQLGPRPIGPTGGPVAPAPAPVARRELAPNATLVSREDLTPAIARFIVRPDAGVPSFKPGQYFALGLQVDGTLLQRPYSTASRAGETEHLEFLIRRVATGTFTPALWQVAPGGRVWIGPPKGLFTLRPGDGRTHLFISTGTGLAPFLSMSESLLGGSDTDTTAPRLAVIHGVSYVSELAYLDRLQAWSAAGRLTYIPTVSRPQDPANAGWSGITGRTEVVLGRVCDELALDPQTTIAYICGNPEMIEAAVEILRGRGFADEAIVRENYWTNSGGTSK